MVPFSLRLAAKGQKVNAYVGDILVGDPNENASGYPKTYQKGEWLMFICL